MYKVITATSETFLAEIHLAELAALLELAGIEFTVETVGRRASDK